MWHFRWSKHTPTPRTYFQRSTPHPRTYILRVCHICLELTYVWRRLAAHRSSGIQRVESVEQDIDELAGCRHISGKPSHHCPPGLSVVRTSHSSTVLDSWILHLSTQIIVPQCRSLLLSAQVIVPQLSAQVIVPRFRSLHSRRYIRQADDEVVHPVACRNTKTQWSNVSNAISANRLTFVVYFIRVVMRLCYLESRKFFFSIPSAARNSSRHWLSLPKSRLTDFCSLKPLLNKKKNYKFAAVC